MNLGDRLKEARKSKGFSQEELANKIGISKNAVWNYENNKRKPAFDTLLKLAKALETNLDYFIEYESERTISLFDRHNTALDNYLNSLGFNIIYDEEDAHLVLNARGHEYEITLSDLDEIKTSVRSFTEFKIHEIINKSRKFK